MTMGSNWLLWFDMKRNCAETISTDLANGNWSQNCGKIFCQITTCDFYPLHIQSLRRLTIAYSGFSFVIECQWRWEVSPPLRWRRKNVHHQEEIQNQMMFKGREVVTVVQTPAAVEKVQCLKPVSSTLILTMDLLSKHFRNLDNINC